VSAAAFANDARFVRPAVASRHARDASTTATTGIARLAELTGVTPKALRYYEARGILRPIRSRSGARLFTPHQCDIAVAVVLLRRLGVGLDEIEPIVADAAAATYALQGLKGLLDRKIEEVAQRLEDVRAAAKKMRSGS